MVKGNADRQPASEMHGSKQTHARAILKRLRECAGGWQIGSPRDAEALLGREQQGKTKRGGYHLRTLPTNRQPRYLWRAKSHNADRVASRTLYDDGSAVAQHLGGRRLA